MASTFTPPVCAARDEVNASVRAVAMEVPFSMAASLSGIEAFGSNSVLNAWLI